MSAVVLGYGAVTNVPPVEGRSESPGKEMRWGGTWVGPERVTYRTRARFKDGESPGFFRPWCVDRDAGRSVSLARTYPWHWVRQSPGFHAVAARLWCASTATGDLASGWSGLPST